MNTYREYLYDAWAQQFSVDKVYFEEKTDHQHLVIFDNAIFGRVMALDGIIQTCEKDEFIYHEMLTHVPLFAHAAPKSVLIIGGGDGGMLREVCRHSGIQRVVQVEIDEAVVEMCKTYLPNHSQGAYDDPRLQLVIDDGLNYVASEGESFDVIISDSTDPIGPGESLFTSRFYEGCRNRLNEGGVLVTQNGVAFTQPGEVSTTAKRMGAYFADQTFYAAAVPTYVGGVMCFAWGSDDPTLRQHDTATIQERWKQSGITTRYYNAGVHTGSFALPQYIIEAMQQ